jgi:TM2 domain-containing membrane protein YozV
MELKGRISTHSVPLGYLLWIFGFTGAHRFYYGRTWTGILYYFTFGLFLIGWVVDFFLIPNMERESNQRYSQGTYDYSIAWLLLTFLGIFGAHRFYLGKWISGIIYLCTGGFFFLGILYDFLNINEMVSEQNQLS